MIKFYTARDDHFWYSFNKRNANDHFNREDGRVYPLDLVKTRNVKNRGYFLNGVVRHDFIDYSLCVRDSKFIKDVI